MRANGLPLPQLRSVCFRTLSRQELSKLPWLRAPCYVVTPAIEPYALDPASVGPLLSLDLAA
jgi:hypothetical protein